MLEKKRGGGGWWPLLSRASSCAWSAAISGHLSCRGLSHHDPCIIRRNPFLPKQHSLPAGFHPARPTHLPAFPYFSKFQTHSQIRRQTQRHKARQLHGKDPVSECRLINGLSPEPRADAVPVWGVWVERSLASFRSSLGHVRSGS